MRIAVLVKQVPAIGDVGLTDDGRLDRTVSAGELNPHCRRAVSKGVELARETGGCTTVFTLGPPRARQVLVEALDFGCDQAVLVSDPAFAGSDTLATARALARALRMTGPFDLVLTGQASVDSSTGQVGPQLAHLLGLPYLDGVRELQLAAGLASMRCERDDGWRRVQVVLPAVLGCAERLCDPAKRPDAVETEELRQRITVLDAADLGPGEWGQDGSPTRVGAVRRVAASRRPVLAGGNLEDQVDQLLAVIAAGTEPAVGAPPMSASLPPDVDTTVAVLAQPGREQLTRELLGGARRLSRGEVSLVGFSSDLPAPTAYEWGADRLIEVRTVAEFVSEADAARAVCRWCDTERPSIVLAPATSWGREIAARVAAETGAGLVGDAIALRVVDGALVCDKPVAGGHTVAEVHVDSELQLATVRPGVLTPAAPRPPVRISCETVTVDSTCPIVRLEEFRDATIDELANARVVLGLGAGVHPEDYPLATQFAALFGAEVAATRRVTDRGWQPHSRQVGVTGRSIAPAVYLALGVAGKNYHVIGIRGAGTVVAVNSDPHAPIFAVADLGIVARWQDVAAAALERHRRALDALPISTAQA
jgi:electron transfer flavoprotein alpha subunit